MPAGSLSLFRWHARQCRHRAKGRKWTRCQCGIWTQGSLSGQWVKMSLHTRNWAAAAKIIHNWEATGKIGEEPPDIRNVSTKADQAHARNLERMCQPRTHRIVRLKREDLGLVLEALNWRGKHGAVKIALEFVTMVPRDRRFPAPVGF